MSDIPKSERTESRLRAQHQAYQIRARITAELMASFAYSQKKQEAHIRKMVQHVKDPEAREEMAKAIREQEEDFACWFIKRERDRVADFCQGIARERRKLKAYKRKLDEGAMPYEDIENSFKSWIGSNWKTMSMQQISNMSLLYYQLFERRPKWRKHSRLRWLMGQPWRTSSSTGTISSAAPS